LNILTGLAEVAPAAVQILEKLKAKKTTDQTVVLLAVLVQKHEDLMEKLTGLETHLKEQDDSLLTINRALQMQGTALDLLLKKK
jgi:hypothetical protein